MSAGAIKAGKGFLELFLKSDKLDSGLVQVSKRISKFSLSIGAIGAGLSGFGGSIIGPMFAMAKGAADLGDNIRDMSIRTGVSTEALSELGYAAEQSGTDLGTVEGSIRKMQKTLTSSSGGKALAAIGMSLKDLQGLSPDEQFTMIGDAISSIEDPMKRTAAWMAIFGKTGTALGPMFENGAKGVADMRQEAQALGRTISGEDAAAADEYNDSWNGLMSTWKSAKFAIGSALLPTLTAATKAITEWTKPIVMAVKNNKDLIVTVFKVGAVIAGVGTALVGMATAGLFVAGAMAGIGAIGSTVIAVLGAVLSPIGLLVAGTVAAVAAFVMFTETGRAMASSIAGGLLGLWETAKAVIGGVFNAIIGGNWALAGSIAMTALQGAILSGFQLLSQLVGGALGDFLGTFATQVAGGDFVGAWNTAIAGMGSVFAAFAEGVFSIWANIARKITELWSKTVNAIANKILELASDDGIVGTALSKVLGVDMAAEKKRADKMNAELAKRGTKTDDFGTANQKAVADSVAAQRSVIDQAIARAEEAGRRQTDEAAKTLSDATRSGATALDDAIASNSSQMAMLLEQAKQIASAKQMSVASQGVPQIAGLATANMIGSVGTFSGTAARFSGLANPGREDKQVELLEKIADHLDGIEDNTKDGGGEFAP